MNTIDSRNKRAKIATVLTVIGIIIIVILSVVVSKYIIVGIVYGALGIFLFFATISIIYWFWLDIFQ